MFFGAITLGALTLGALTFVSTAFIFKFFTFIMFCYIMSFCFLAFYVTTFFAPTATAAKYPQKISSPLPYETQHFQKPLLMLPRSSLTPLRIRSPVLNRFLFSHTPPIHRQLR